MAGWDRGAQVDKLEQVEGYQQQGQSQRQAAAAAGVARSTLRHWQQRQADCDLAPEVGAFFDSPHGLQLLHRIVAAAHLVITLQGSGGIRLVCQFLELSGLSALVGSSYGAQQALAAALEEAVVDYAQQERARLGALMPQRRISLCEDETFHPQVCLVGIEAVSNFIVLEGYAPGRRSAQWTGAVQAALEGLAVEVVQVTSDQAQGLCHHVTHRLGAHQSPDLFHLQQDISRATAPRLAAQLKAAQQSLLEAEQHLQAQQAAQRAFEQGPRRRGRPADFAQRLQQARYRRAAAELEVERVKEYQQQAQELRQQLSAAYHPYDLQTAAPQSPQRLLERLEDCWQRLNVLAQAAGLPERCRRYLRKAQRLTPALVSTLPFYFTTVTAKVEALGVSDTLQQLLYQRLIPALYLERVAGRSTKAQPRQALSEQVETLLAPLKASEGPLAGVDAQQRQRLEEVASECADLFQRSSSCVEGRNGQLALHHHRHHHLSERKLAALTALHNYLIRRPDGTTAAERFFGQPPADLFEAVLARVPLPSRPAQKRPRPPKTPHLRLVET